MPVNLIIIVVVLVIVVIAAIVVVVPQRKFSFSLFYFCVLQFKYDVLSV
jgi:hypothetical protein